MHKGIVAGVILLIACGPTATGPDTTQSGSAQASVPPAAPTAPTSVPSPASTSTLAPTPPLPTSPPALVASVAPASPASTAGPTHAPAPTAAPLATPSPTTPTPARTPPPTPAGPVRATVDRPDDLTGAQVHVMYVLPSDGTDERLDLDGRIANAVSAMQLWLATQTGGRALRVDTFNGAVDVTFFRMSQTDAAVAASGAFVRDRIEAELKGAGLVRGDRIYAVYYGGSSTFACGGGAWPPTLPGVVAAQYLKGAIPGAIPCSANPVGQSAFFPGYQEFAMLHEILHTMGLVATCAPHHTRSGHSSEDPRDLMYAGDQVWRPSILDIGRDDYYGHSIPGCPDLAKSAYLSG